VCSWRLLVVACRVPSAGSFGPTGQVLGDLVDAGEPDEFGDLLEALPLAPQFEYGGLADDPESFLECRDGREALAGFASARGGVFDLLDLLDAVQRILHIVIVKGALTLSRDATVTGTLTSVQVPVTVTGTWTRELKETEMSKQGPTHIQFKSGDKGKSYAPLKEDSTWKKAKDEAKNFEGGKAVRRK
jgi:hypothetical protein